MYYADVCCEFNNWWIKSQHPAHLPTTASKCSSNLTPSSHPSASPPLPHYNVGVYLYDYTIMATKLSLNSLNYHFQVRLIMGSTCIWKLAQSQHWCSHGRSIQVHLQPLSISASKCFSQLTQCLLPGASPNSLDHGLQVYLHTLSIMASMFPQFLDSKCITKFTQSWPWSVSLSSVDYQLHTYHSMPWSTNCNPSRYTVCRWVAISINRYINSNMRRQTEYMSLKHP